MKCFLDNWHAYINVVSWETQVPLFSKKHPFHHSQWTLEEDCWNESLFKRFHPSTKQGNTDIRRDWIQTWSDVASSVVLRCCTCSTRSRSSMEYTHPCVSSIRPLNWRARYLQMNASSSNINPPPPLFPIHSDPGVKLLQLPSNFASNPSLKSMTSPIF